MREWCPMESKHLCVLLPREGENACAVAGGSLFMLLPWEGETARVAELKSANKASEPFNGAWQVCSTMCWHAWASAAAAADKLVSFFTGWERPWQAVGHRLLKAGLPE